MVDIKNQNNDCTLIEDANVALELVEKERVFILLTPRHSYLREGHGLPLVGNGIYLFNNYNDAKNCIDSMGLDRWDDVYPIGSLDKADKFTNIKNTIMIANAMGVENVFLDGNSFFQTHWFLKTVGVEDKMQFEVRLTAIESENIQEIMKKTELPIRFNPINLYDYSNPFEISDERKAELSQKIVSPDGDNEKEVLKSISKNSLHENCYAQMIIRSTDIPMSIQKADMNGLNYFNMIQTVYAKAIVKQLGKHKSLYVLCDKESHEVFVRDSPMRDGQKLFYVAYTDLFKHQGPLEYKKIVDMKELKALVKQCKVDGIVLTDGPSVNAVIDKGDL